MLTLKSGTIIKVASTTSRSIQTYDYKSPSDGSLREDQDEYEDDPKRSSDAKVVTNSEMLMLTPDYKMAKTSINMTSYGKRTNIKVVRLVESVDFDIKIVLIRGCMQPAQPKQGQGQKAAGSFRTDRVEFTR